MRRARWLIGFGLLLALSVAPVARADDPPAIPDQTTDHVPWNPKGAPPVETVNVTATTFDNGQAGSIDLGHTNGTSNGSSGAGGTGGTGAGPVVPTCIDSGVIVDGTVPLPGLSIATDPPVQKAVVGVPTWFWTEPYSGGVFPPQPIHAFYFHCNRWTDADGNLHADQEVITVPLNVTVWAAHVRWDWGDNTHASEDCGPPDEPSACGGLALGRKDQADLKKMYEDSSARRPDGYDVALTVGFQARLGGPGGPVLGPYWQGAHLDLPVREVQSIFVQP